MPVPPLAPLTTAVYSPAGRWSTSADSTSFGGESAFLWTSIAFTLSRQLSLVAMAVPVESKIVSVGSLSTPLIPKRPSDGPRARTITVVLPTSPTVKPLISTFSSVPTEPRVLMFFNLELDSDESVRRVIQVQNRIAENTGNPKAAERWPQGPKHYGLRFGPGDDKATDQN